MGNKAKGQATQYLIAFAGKGPVKRHLLPFSMRDAEHVFERKDITSDLAVLAELDVVLEEVANEPSDTPSGPTRLSDTLMKW